MSRHFHTTRADRIAADIARQKNAEFLAEREKSKPETCGSGCPCGSGDDGLMCPRADGSLLCDDQGATHGN